MSRYLGRSWFLAPMVLAVGLAGAFASPFSAATATPEPTAEPTSETTTLGALIWGDSLCDGALDLADAIETLKISSSIPGQNNPPCPVRGAGILIGGAPHHWGDNDCDLSVGPLDSLPIITHFAQLVRHIPECPDVGDEVVLDN